VSTILIIEDDHALRHEYRQALEVAGYKVVDAEDGLDGFRRFREHPVDLVITEMMLPRQDGLETIVGLRREFPEVKIIAIVENGKNGSKHKPRTAQIFGVQHTLAKPVAAEPLLETVRKVLGDN